VTIYDIISVWLVRHVIFFDECANKLVHAPELEGRRRDLVFILEQKFVTDNSFYAKKTDSMLLTYGLDIRPILCV
jgi:hypothetical protein